MSVYLKIITYLFKKITEADTGFSEMGTWVVVGMDISYMDIS